MCDQTIPYIPGDLVWVKLRTIWWPSTVVDHSNIETLPSDVQKAIAKKKKEYIIVVKFEDNYYEIISNLSHICYYDNDKKLEFLEKGHSLYTRQKKGLSTQRLPFDMKKFVEHVIAIERGIKGGNVNIFKQFEEIEVNLTPKSYIKELFSTSKQKKKQGQESHKIVLPTLKTPVSNIRKSKAAKNFTPTSANSSFSCHVKSGCKFSTNSFDILKRHMASHKTEEDELKTTKKSPSLNKTAPSCSSSKALFQTSKKRKSRKSLPKSTKKVKIQDELLKDWELDDDNSVDCSNAKNEVNVPSNSSNKIFDFDENDENTRIQIIKPLRKSIISVRSSSEESHYSNDPDSSFETNLTSQNCVKRMSYTNSETKFDKCSSPIFINENLPNNISNQIEDQSESTKLLLENTGSTLNQLCHLEDTLNSISTNIKSPEISSKNKEVVDLANNFDKLKTKNDSLNSSENINNETDGQDITMKNALVNQVDKVTTEEEQSDDKKNNVDGSQETSKEINSGPIEDDRFTWALAYGIDEAKLMSDMDFKTRRKHLTENPEIIDCVEVPIITSSIQPDLPAGYTRRIVRVPESGGNLQPLPDEELLQRPEVIEFREYLKTSSAANTRQLFIDLRPAKPE